MDNDLHSLEKKTKLHLGMIYGARIFAASDVVAAARACGWTPNARQRCSVSGLLYTLKDAGVIEDARDGKGGRGFRIP